MIVCMFLLVAVVVGLLLGMWQDINRTIEMNVEDLLNELRFNPDHAIQMDGVGENNILDVDFDVYADDYIEEAEESELFYNGLEG